MNLSENAQARKNTAGGGCTKAPDADCPEGCENAADSGGIGSGARPPVTVYLKAEAHSQIDAGNAASCCTAAVPVYIGDVACVYCRDKALEAHIRGLCFTKLDAGSSGKRAFSVMALVQCIEEGCEAPVLVQNIGEADFLISVKKEEKKGLALAVKILCVTLVTFFGSIFAIMTYNEDVDVSGVFDKLYRIVMGSTRTAPGILEGAYAVGVGLGIIVFFNHFGRRKLTKDPTPMEIEMEKYEKDIDDTLIKKASRKSGE